MGNVYESLKEVVTLQRNKKDPIALAGVKQTHTPSLDEEIDELQARIGVLKAAVKQREEVVTKETQHAEQVIETHRRDIEMLETKLKEAEELLQSRNNEINNLKSRVDFLVKQVTESELAIKQAKANATTEGDRAKQLTESSNIKIAALETRIKELEEELTAKTQVFENQLRNKETGLRARDAELNNLKSQLQVLTRGIKEISSFVNQAEASASVDKKNVNTIGTAAKPALSELKGPLVPPVPTAAQQTVPPAFFDLMTEQLTLIMGPMASIIIRDHVAALGESMEKFPESRLSELLDILSEEISNEKLKIGFRKWFVKHI